MDASLLLRVSIVANHMGLNILISPQGYCLTINSNNRWKQCLIISRIDKTISSYYSRIRHFVKNHLPSLYFLQ